MSASPIRTVIVDDEPLIRRRLRRILQSDPEIEIVGEYANGRDAQKGIVSLSPDLVLLDIQMPEKNGFEVLEGLGGKLPYVIFVTAYDQYALQAFSVHAVDYLLKPFGEDRLLESLRLAKDRIRHDRTRDMTSQIQSLLNELRGKSGYAERIMLRDLERVWFVKVEDIDWIEAQAKYVLLHAIGEPQLLRESLSALEQKLDPAKFTRVNRSAIVNLDRVKELQKWFHGDYRVVLQDGTTLTLSRMFKNKVYEALEKSG